MEEYLLEHLKYKFRLQVVVTLLVKAQARLIWEMGLDVMEIEPKQEL